MFQSLLKTSSGRKDTSPVEPEPVPGTSRMNNWEPVSQQPEQPVGAKKNSSSRGRPASKKKVIILKVLFYYFYILFIQKFVSNVKLFNLFSSLNLTWSKCLSRFQAKEVTATESKDGTSSGLEHTACGKAASKEKVIFFFIKVHFYCFYNIN